MRIHLQMNCEFICIYREVPLSEDFISAHILTEEDGGFFSSR